MGAWFVGSKEMSQVYEALDAMKSDPAECDDLGRDRWVAFLKGADRWNDTVCAATRIPAIMFDGGGSISRGEPTVSWEANGAKMETFVRHLPFTLAVFKGLEPQPNPALAGCMGFGGFCRKYILSIPTVQASITDMERLLKGTADLRRELEASLQENTFNGNPHVVSIRKCGCLSGRTYGDCCGKAVESAEHRKTRLAMENPERL